MNGFWIPKVTEEGPEDFTELALRIILSITVHE